MNESDRDLLELAAKAAGIKIDRDKHNGGGRLASGFDALGNAVLDWHNGTIWNPLTDDGDALRLAVKLRIDLGWVGQQVAANNCTEIGDYAATRRAIVRAASEIGKTMK